MKKIRQDLRRTLKKYDAKFWQSEICIMSNDEEIGGGGGYDFTMKTALYVARIIHHDLVYANAESWSWWRACGGNYKDGLIRVFDRQHHARDSKLMWALGNYSRFVRPGAVRYEVTSKEKEDPYGLMLSAYRNADGSWVVVAINYGSTPQDVILKMLDGKQHRWQAYRTSDAEGENLKPSGESDGQASLPARSITTFCSGE
jgi:O-glycosyl hydrolase